MSRTDEQDRHAWKNVVAERRPKHAPTVVNVPKMGKRFAVHADGSVYELRKSGNRKVRDAALLAALRDTVDSEAP